MVYAFSQPQLRQAGMLVVFMAAEGCRQRHVSFRLAASRREKKLLPPAFSLKGSAELLLSLLRCFCRFDVPSSFQFQYALSRFSFFRADAFFIFALSFSAITSLSRLMIFADADISFRLFILFSLHFRHIDYDAD